MAEHMILTCSRRCVRRRTWSGGGGRRTRPSWPPGCSGTRGPRCARTSQSPFQRTRRRGGVRSWMIRVVQVHCTTLQSRPYPYLHLHHLLGDKMNCKVCLVNNFLQVLLLALVDKVAGQAYPWNSQKIVHKTYCTAAVQFTLSPIAPPTWATMLFSLWRHFNSFKDPSCGHEC